MPDPQLTERVREWQRRGASERFREHSIHTFRQEAEGPLLLLLHGFPSSSYDWRLLLEEDVPSNVLGFDFLGFGLSDKPRGHDYSLFWQADLSEELVRRHGDGRPVLIVAHDMGTSVASLGSAGPGRDHRRVGGAAGASPAGPGA